MKVCSGSMARWRIETKMKRRKIGGRMMKNQRFCIEGVNFKFIVCTFPTRNYDQRERERERNRNSEKELKLFSYLVVRVWHVW